MTEPPTDSFPPPFLSSQTLSQTLRQPSLLSCPLFLSLLPLARAGRCTGCHWLCGQRRDPRRETRVVTAFSEQLLPGLVGPEPLPRSADAGLLLRIARGGGGARGQLPLSLCSFLKTTGSQKGCGWENRVSVSVAGKQGDGPLPRPLPLSSCESAGDWQGSLASVPWDCPQLGAQASWKSLLLPAGGPQTS